jgi:hypothetical protein
MIASLIHPPVSYLRSLNEIMPQGIGLVIFSAIHVVIFKVLRHPETRATADYLDTRQRWTDRYSDGVLFCLVIAITNIAAVAPGLFYAAMTLNTAGGAKLTEVLLKASYLTACLVACMLLWVRRLAGLYLLGTTMVISSTITIFRVMLPPDAASLNAIAANRTKPIIVCVVTIVSAVIGIILLRRSFEVAPHHDSDFNRPIPVQVFPESDRPIA